MRKEDEKNPTTVRLTEKAQAIKDDLATIFGLKNILSAGLILFSRLSAEEKQSIIADANGIETEDPAEHAAYIARWCIKAYQGLSNKNFAVSLNFPSLDARYLLSDKKINEVNAIMEAEKKADAEFGQLKNPVYYVHPKQ